MKPALIIIGLGNKGKEYSHTRHNIGWLALDILSDVFAEGEWKENKNFLANVQEGRISTFPILMVKPNTFMNRSGESLHKIVQYYKLNPQTQVLILVDDIDLPLGTIRLRMQGGPGTHNGLKSIVQSIGKDIPRLKIGIGNRPDGADLAEWVLSNFSKNEQDILLPILDTLPKVVTELLFKNQIEKEPQL